MGESRRNMRFICEFFKRKVYWINENPASEIYIKTINNIGINKEDFQDWLKSKEKKPIILNYISKASDLIQYPS